MVSTEKSTFPGRNLPAKSKEKFGVPAEDATGLALADVHGAVVAPARRAPHQRGCREGIQLLAFRLRRVKPLQQTFEDWFSAVSKPIIARKHTPRETVLESYFRISSQETGNPNHPRTHTHTHHPNDAVGMHCEKANENAPATQLFGRFS